MLVRSVASCALLVTLASETQAVSPQKLSLVRWPQPIGLRTQLHAFGRAYAPVMIRDDLPAYAKSNIIDDKVLLGTIELSDLSACIDLLMDSFYKDIVTLAADEFSEEELTLIKPTLAKINGFFTAMTRAFITLDTLQRVGGRLLTGGIGLSGRSSVFLGLQHQPSGRIIGVVDLSVQPKDGRVPGDVRLPRWATRDIADIAYVASLTVSRDFRGQGYGSAMLHACENVAQREWGYSEIYLHAATKDEALLVMYSRLGYEQLPSFDQPRWVLALSGREATRFHRRSLDTKVSQS